MDIPELPGLPGVHELLGGTVRAFEIKPDRWIDDDGILALGTRYDLLLFERFADGTILVTPPSGWEGAGRDSEVIYQVLTWVRSGDHGFAMGATGGVHFPDGALLAPDATYVSRERWARTDREKTYAWVVPDAVFEILSKSDRVRTTMKKIAAYLRNGVRLVVLIDPKRRKVYVGREGDAEPHDLGDVENVDCSPVMPGFVLDVAGIVNVG
jgi:Uma2 family endonuclease